MSGVQLSDYWHVVPNMVTVVFTTGESATYGHSSRRLIPPYKKGYMQLSRLFSVFRTSPVPKHQYALEIKWVLAFPRPASQIPIQWSRVESGNLHFYKAPSHCGCTRSTNHTKKPYTRPPVYKIIKIKHLSHCLACAQEIVQKRPCTWSQTCKRLDARSWVCHLDLPWPCPPTCPGEEKK